MKKIIVLIMAILLAQSVFSIGIGPAKTNILFEPNLTTQYTINLYNEEGKNFEASLKLEGELEQYLFLESQSITLNEQDSSKPIHFNVSFPRDVPPGSYSSQLKIIQTPIASQGTITALLGLVHDITLEVPTHGKYVKEFIERTDDALLITIKNIGLKEINKLEVLSNVSDAEKEIISTESKNNFLSDETVNMSIDLDLPNGRYSHKLTIEYDELTKNITGTLLIGEIEISITDLEIGEGKVGEIIPIDVSLSSNWNGELGNIFVEIDVFNQEGLIDSFRGPVFRIKNNQITRLFWDTQGLSEGEYNFVVKVFHNDKIVSEKVFETVISEKEVSAKRKIAVTNKVVILSIIIIILASIIIILERNKKSKSPKKSPKKKKNLNS